MVPHPISTHPRPLRRGHLGILFTLLGEFLDQLEAEGNGDDAANTDRGAGGRTSRPENSGSLNGGAQEGGSRGNGGGEVGGRAPTASPLDTLLPASQERDPVARYVNAGCGCDGWGRDSLCESLCMRVACVFLVLDWRAEIEPCKPIQGKLANQADVTS